MRTRHTVHQSEAQPASVWPASGPHLSHIDHGIQGATTVEEYVRPQDGMLAREHIHLNLCAGSRKQGVGQGWPGRVSSHLLMTCR